MSKSIGLLIEILADARQCLLDIMLIINPARIPTGSVGVHYLVQFIASGGEAPYIWTGSDMPNGFVLSPQGKLSGVSNIAVNQTLYLSVTDSSVPALFLQAYVQFTIGAAKRASVCAVTSDNNPSNFCDALTLTATVTGSAGTPGGTVVFLDGTTAIASVALNALGMCDINITSLSIGVHPISVQYSGNAKYDPATSSVFSQVVNKAASGCTLASNKNPANFCTPLTLTVTVTGSAGIPGGMVRFYEGTTSIGSVALNGSGVGTISISHLSIGTHLIAVQYSGDANYEPSTSDTIPQVVNRAVSVSTLSSSSNPNVFGTPVTFAATVSGAAGIPGGTVTVHEGTKSIGSATLDAVGAASISIPGLSAGTHSITLQYSGDDRYCASNSAVLVQVVGKAMSYCSLSSTNNPNACNSPITLYATVTAFNGTPTGTVTFPNGGGTMAITDTQSGPAVYMASCGAEYSFTAQYNGDTNYAPSTSNTIIQVSAAMLTISPVDQTFQEWQPMALQFMASGGIPPLRWTIQNGGGFSITEGGLLSGVVPCGFAQFQVTATDSSGASQEMTCNNHIFLIRTGDGDYSAQTITTA